MQQYNLTGLVREEKGSANARRLRKQDFIPAIIYGIGMEPLKIKVLFKDLQNMGKLSKSVIINLAVKDKNTYSVILKDLQRDLISDIISNIDFQQVSLTEKMIAKVSLHFIGEAKGVKEGGILEPLSREIKLKCLPTELPESIEVDVSNLSIGSTLHIKDLKIKEGIEVLSESDEGIVTVLAPVVEEKKAEETAEIIGEGEEEVKDEKAEGSPETKTKEKGESK